MTPITTTATTAYPQHPMAQQVRNLVAKMIQLPFFSPNEKLLVIDFHNRFNVLQQNFNANKDEISLDCALLLNDVIYSARERRPGQEAELALSELEEEIGAAAAPALPNGQTIHDLATLCTKVLHRTQNVATQLMQYEGNFPQIANGEVQSQGENA